MSPFARVVSSLTRVLNWVGTSVLVIMMALVVVNILTRPFSLPILGTHEVVSYGLVVVVSFGRSPDIHRTRWPRQSAGGPCR